MFAALFAAIAALVLVACVAVPLAVIRGYVLSHLWLWFFVPLGVPAIHVVAAIGIALTVGFLLEGLSTDSKTDKPVVQVIVAFLSPFLVLAIGYVVHCFL